MIEYHLKMEIGRHRHAFDVLTAMATMSRGFVFAAVLLLAVGMTGETFGAAPASQGDIFVSPTGEVKTIAVALERIRASRKSDERCRPVEICIGPGRYRVTAPIVIGPEDSGLHFCGPDDGSAVIDGGVEIGPFVAGADGIWSAKAPKGLLFDQLWVNGRRAVRARTPNGNAFLYMKEPDPDHPRDAFYADVDDVRPLASLGPAELSRVLIGYWLSWDMGLAPVISVDPSTGRVLTKRNQELSYFHFDRTRPRYMIENYRAALDEPGEWFLDVERSMVLYVPRIGECAEKTVATAPVLPTVIHVRGNSDGGMYVRDVSIKGLSVEHAALPIGSDGIRNCQSAINVRPAAVLVEGADNFVFENGRISHVGGHGIWLRKGTRNSRIKHALIEDLGVGGVLFGDGKVDFQHLERNSSFLSLEDSIVRHGGRLINGAVGVWLGQVRDCRIVHNEICDFFYTGVSLGWTWGYAKTVTRRNHVDFNHIHHIQQGRLSDGGAVYLLGDQSGSTVCNNWIHDVNGYRDNGSPAWGLYTDEGATRILLASNLVERCRSGAAHQHYGRENTFANNIFATFDDFGFWRTRAENHVTVCLTNNIFWWTNPSASAYECRSAGSVRDILADGNVYWCASGPVGGKAFNHGSWAQWRDGGNDARGAIADPRFVAPDAGDWSLRADSPALAAGFVPFDWRRAGVLANDADWRREAATQTWDEFKDAVPAPPYCRERVRADFNALGLGPVMNAMNALSPFSSTDGRPGGIEVVPGADGTGNAVKLTELDDNGAPWNPIMTLRHRIIDGCACYRFWVKGSTNCNSTVEWRDYDLRGDFATGARIQLSGGYVRGADGSPLCALNPDQWVKVEVAIPVEGPRAGKWTCTVTPQGGKQKSVVASNWLDRRFSHPTELLFISYGSVGTSWCVDDVELWKESSKRISFQTQKER